MYIYPFHLNSVSPWTHPSSIQTGKIMALIHMLVTSLLPRHTRMNILLIWMGRAGHYTTVFSCPNKLYASIGMLVCNSENDFKSRVKDVYKVFFNVLHIKGGFSFLILLCKPLPLSLLPSRIGLMYNFVVFYEKIDACACCKR